MFELLPWWKFIFGTESLFFILPPLMKRVKTPSSHQYEILIFKVHDFKSRDARKSLRRYSPLYLILFHLTNEVFENLEKNGIPLEFMVIEYFSDWNFWSAHKFPAFIVWFSLSCITNPRSLDYSPIFFHSETRCLLTS